MDRLSDKTLIPLGLAILAIGSAAIWMTTVHLQLTHAQVSILEVKEEQKTYNAHVAEIREELSGIKGEMKRLRR